jgi:DNA modification methylase
LAEFANEIQLFEGDCLDLMGNIPDGSIDMIAADLPYGTTACKWDTVIPFAPLWAQYKRIIKPRGAIVLTASQPFTSALVMSNPGWFRYETVWEKPKAIGFLWARRRPLATHENIVVFGDSLGTYNPQMSAGEPYCRGISSRAKPITVLRQGQNAKDSWVESKTGERFPRSVVKIRNAEFEGKSVHPTQKPVALFEYLIRTYTNEGELVVDNTCGSGTTGIACLNTGRRFIGIEKDAEIFATASARVEAAQVARSELLIV